MLTNIKSSQGFLVLAFRTLELQVSYHAVLASKRVPEFQALIIRLVG